MGEMTGLCCAGNIPISKKAFDQKLKNSSHLSGGFFISDLDWRAF